MRIVKLFGKGVLILALSLMAFIAWKSNVDRPKQVTRLRRQYRLVGMNRQQVVRLLGKPDESSNKQMLYSWSEFMGVGFLMLKMESERVIAEKMAHD